MTEEKDERRGFQVKDRRRFSETGETRSDAPDEPRPETPDAPPSTTTAPPRQPFVDEPVTFSTFILGLSTQALLHLGEIPNPLSNTVERDLDAAKHVIDILGILQEKTRNNLEAGEQGLLESALYDLRMRYVELMRGRGKEGK